MKLPWPLIAMIVMALGTVALMCLAQPAPPGPAPIATTSATKPRPFNPGGPAVLQGGGTFGQGYRSGPGSSPGLFMGANGQLRIGQ